MPKSLFFVAALAAASISVPAFAQESVTPLSVSGRAPTTLTVATAGKTKAVVNRAVLDAAKTVCRNAVTNRELEFYDVSWCSGIAHHKAMVRYSAMVSKSTLADSGVIVLSAR